jgi:hypothetical protein
VDVLASAAILPVAVLIGLALHRWWERRTVNVPTTLDR